MLKIEAVKYARSLIDLEFRKNTIAINAKNYRDKLTQLKLDIATQKKYNGSDADLSFLESFTTETCPQFEEQIEFDLRYFRHGTGLLDKAMEAIRGTVAIEEAYRDAKLEVTIQAVGFGLGVAGVVASSAPYLIKEEPGLVPLNLPFAKLQIPGFALVLLMSIGAGVAVWLLLLSIKSPLKRGTLSKKIHLELPPVPPFLRGARGDRNLIVQQTISRYESRRLSIFAIAPPKAKSCTIGLFKKSWGKPNSIALTASNRCICSAVNSNSTQARFS